MIKYIVTDLDGTLFEGHGPTVFDLTKENEEGLKLAKEHGIRVLPCSGRPYPYCLRLYDLYDLGAPVLCGGLNGASIYNEKPVASYYLANEDVIKMMELVKSYPDKWFNMQAQDDGAMRYYFYPMVEPAIKYRNETGKEKCTIVSLEGMEGYVRSGGVTCKFSVISKNPEDSKFLEDLIKGSFGEHYNVTRSSSIFLEVNVKEAYKGNFIKYLRELYNLSKDEVAVIGDNHNDLSMYNESNISFAMLSGDEKNKEAATYTVKSVAECIKKCIELNEN